MGHRVAIGAALHWTPEEEHAYRAERFRVRTQEALAHAAQVQAHVAALRELGYYTPAPRGISEGRTFHVCDDGYENYLALNDVCDRCQWAPNLPLPSLGEVTKRLIVLLGQDQASAWSHALVTAVEGTRDRLDERTGP